MYADPRLSSRAKVFIEDAANKGGRIGICTISLAEVVYLVERRRVLANAYDDLLAVLDDHEQVFEAVDLTREIVASMCTIPRDDVPDLPDRIVAATAVRPGVPIISCDWKIQASSVAWVW